jgi:hypothetical protein
MGPATINEKHEADRLAKTRKEIFIMQNEATTPPLSGDLKLERTSGFRRVCGDLLYFMKHEKKWWLLPMIIIVLLIAAMIAFTAASGPLAPFIYSLM